CPDGPGRAGKRMLGRMRRRIVSESKTRQLMYGSWAWTGDSDAGILRRWSFLSYPITYPGWRSRLAASPDRRRYRILGSANQAAALSSRPSIAVRSLTRFILGTSLRSMATWYRSSISMMTRTRSSESSASSSRSNDWGVISKCLDLAETAWIRPTTTGKSSLDDSTVFKEFIMNRLDWEREQASS